MQKILVAFVGIVVLQLTLPSRADAWWEFLEQLSGPGPFQGFDLQFRWPCFVRTLVKEDGKEVYKIQRAPVTLGGAILTLCKLKEGQTRWGAVDTGYRSLWTNGDERFAENKSIRLQTFGATFSYNIFNAHPEGDFVDVATGGAKYWFTSEGFDTFSGFVWEPIRIEFHPTTDFKRSVKWDQYIPVVRAGYLRFPGFDAARFKSRENIDPEWVLKIGLFWDFEFLR